MAPTDGRVAKPENAVGNVQQMSQEWREN